MRMTATSPEKLALQAAAASKTIIDTRAENRALTARVAELEAALGVVLDQVDYTASACAPTEMVGACLSTQVIDIARAALAKEQVMISILAQIAADPSISTTLREAVRPVRYVPCPVCCGRGCHSRRVGAILRHDDCANCAGNGSIATEVAP
jgi:hypothetical protein